MEPTFNVLWFDDDHDELLNLKIEAEKQGIILYGFPSAREGLDELEKRKEFYDAVLFDALFFLHKGQPKGSQAPDGLKEAWERVGQMSKRFERLVHLTGQETLEKSDVFKGAYGKFYLKYLESEREQLWKELRIAAEGQPDAQTRHRYQKVFDACGVLILEEKEEVIKYLHQILRSTHEDGGHLEDKLYFTQLRILLEGVFRTAHRLGLVHDKCIPGGKVNLTACSLFLSGKEPDRLFVQSRTKHFPELIEGHVRHILDVTNAFSHTEDPERRASKLRIAEYRDTVKSPYLLYSLTFQLMDVLLWFKAYADANSNVEANKALWVNTTPRADDSDAIRGKVTNIDKKGNAFFKADGDGITAFIRVELAVKHGLSAGTAIAVRTRPSEPTVTHIELLS